MKKSFFSIAGILLLGALALVGQLVFPNKKSLADIASMAEVYRNESPGDELVETAYASDGSPAQEAAEQRAALTSDPSKLFDQLERVEDKLLDNEEDVQVGKSDARVEALEAQQEQFVREIARLRNELQQREEQAAQHSAPQAALPAVSIPVDNSKDRENLKLLANHILKLRETLKSEKEASAAKDTEIGSLKRRLSELEQVSDETRRATESRSEELSSAVAGLREKIYGLENEKKALEEKLRVSGEELSTKLRSGEDELKQTSTELEDTKRQLSKTIEDAKSCNMTLTDKEKTAAGIPALNSRIGELEKTVAEREKAVAERDKELASLKGQLADREQIVGSIPGMKKELLAAKNQLLMKEKELQLAGKGASIHSGVSQEEQDRHLEESGRRAGEETIRGKAAPVTSDVMVIEVLKDRVALRSGPSPDDSEIMPVGRGTRLTVEERTGEWYRVIAPNSMRAFIRADMVRIFSPGGEAPREQVAQQRRAPKKTARKVMADDPNMEAFGNVSANAPRSDRETRALERLRSGMEGGEKPSAPEMIP